jgi:hypothetical protein
VSVIAGDTFRVAFTSTYEGDLSAATKLWLSMKYQRSLDDSAGYVFLEKTAGLTVLNGAAYATPAHGTLVVTGIAGAWIITTYIDEIATLLLRGINNRGVLLGVKAKIGADTISLVDDGRAPGYVSGASAITDGVVQAIG